MNKINWYKHLLTEPTSYWLYLLEKYLLLAPSVVVKGRPSLEKAKALQEEEKQRVAKRISDYGEEGLKLFGKKVENAEKNNEVKKNLNFNWRKKACLFLLGFFL